MTIKYTKQKVHLMIEHDFSLYNATLKAFATVKKKFISVSVGTGFSLIASKFCSRKR